MNFLFILLFPSIVECLRLEIFESADYHDFKKEFRLSSKQEENCVNTNFPVDFRAKSLKTDKCIIVYEGSSCNAKQADSSQRFEKDNPLLDDDYHRYSLKIGSLHVCSQKLGGGPLLDADFYNEQQLIGNPLVKYTNVCSCQNIPSEFTSVSFPLKIQSVDNHGNSIAIFEKENCEPPYKLFPPGRSYWSDTFYTQKGHGMMDPKAFYWIHSFYPMGTANCVRLDASVVEFVSKNDSSSEKGLEFENVTNSLESVFRNNGSAKITQVYTATQRVKDVFEFTRATGFSNVHTVGVEVGIENKVKFGLPLIAEGKATMKITGKYQWQGTTSGTDTDKRSVENEETISISQSIEIPPCTEYHVNSFVKMVKNYTIEYTAIARLTGKAGESGDRMSKNELTLHIEPGMEFIRDIDDYTIEVSVTGEIFAKYGVKTFIVGQGHPIQGCLKSTNINSIKPATSFVIEHPIHSE